MSTRDCHIYKLWGSIVHVHMLAWFNANWLCFLSLVSMGQLIKQAIADETKSGQACKAYVLKKTMGMWYKYIRTINNGYVVHEYQDNYNNNLSAIISGGSIVAGTFAMPHTAQTVILY